MRVTLVEPNAGIWRTGTFARHASFEPIGTEYVGSTAEAAGHEVVVLQQRNQRTGDFARQVLSTRPDVLGFSTMSYNYPEAVRIAKKAKAERPGLITVIGGSHVTAMPECVDGHWLDVGVLGEGEVTFAQLLKCIDEGRWPCDIQGTARRDSGGFLQVARQRTRVRDLDSLPQPLRSGGLLDGCRVTSLVLPIPSEQRAVAQVTYARGCPFSCSFCTASSFWGRETRYRSVHSVIDELRMLRDRFGTNLVFFTDLTFNASKSRALALCDALITANLGIAWFPMCRLDRMNVELAERMKAAGCTKVSFGIDALDPETLEMVKSSQAFPTGQELSASLSAAWEAGLITKAYVITGYPWESVETMLHSATVLSRLPIDDLRISYLTPFPGTEIRRKAIESGVIETTDWEQYTSDEPVLAVSGSSRAEIRNVRQQMFEIFYHSAAYRWRTKEKIARDPSYRKAIVAHASRLKRVGIRLHVP